MNYAHPKAVLAREKTRLKHEILDNEKQQLELARNQSGLRFLAVRDYTICYRVDRRSVIELSTTIKHPNDRHSKRDAQIIALNRFYENRRIIVKTALGRTPKEQLNDMFNS